MKNLLISILLYAGFLILACQSSLYITEFDFYDPTVLMTQDLPIDDAGNIDSKLMPYVGNGHLASTIFDNKVYVNGLYNGERGESHRARVPNVHDFRILPVDSGGFINDRYVLYVKDGNNKPEKA